MRNLLPILLLLLVNSCAAPDPNEKVEAAIREYLSRQMDDFSSYEPVEYRPIETTKGGYKMKHSYREKNTNGATVLSERNFYFDSAMKVKWASTDEEEAQLELFLFTDSLNRATEAFIDSLEGAK